MTTRDQRIGFLSLSPSGGYNTCRAWVNAKLCYQIKSIKYDIVHIDLYKLNKEKDIHQAKDDSKKEIRLTRLKRLEKKLKSNILKRKQAISKNG